MYTRMVFSLRRPQSQIAGIFQGERYVSHSDRPHAYIVLAQGIQGRMRALDVIDFNPIFPLRDGPNGLQKPQILLMRHFDGRAKEVSDEAHLRQVDEGLHDEMKRLFLTGFVNQGRRISHLRKEFTAEGEGSVNCRAGVKATLELMGYQYMPMQGIPLEKQRGWASTLYDEVRAQERSLEAQY